MGDHIARITVSGELDLSRQIVVRPRPPPKGIAESLTPLEGNNGSLLVAPLQRKDGKWLLIVRGWWPNSQISRTAQSVTEGEALAASILVQG